MLPTRLRPLGWLFLFAFCACSGCSGDGSPEPAGPPRRGRGAPQASDPAAPDLTPMCDCRELLAPEALSAILGVREELTTDGRYNTCRYRLVGDPADRSFVIVSYNRHFPLQKYEGQLRMAKLNAAKEAPAASADVFETDDVGSRSYEFISYTNGKPVFMQKFFLTRDSSCLVSVSVKLKTLDPKTSRLFVPDAHHLSGIARVLAANIEVQKRHWRDP